MKNQVVALLLAIVGAAGCAEQIDEASEQEQASAEQALILSTAKVYHAQSIHTYTTPAVDDYWTTAASDDAFNKAKEFGLPVRIKESLNAGIGAAVAQLIFCHDVNGVQGCESDNVDVFRDKAVKVPYHWNKSQTFNLQLVNNEWIASQIVGGPGGAGGVKAWYAGHVE
jgi:hypothetical protein